MPVAPGATLEVQYMLRSGPFGDVEYTNTSSTVGSRPRVGAAEHPEVIVDVTSAGAGPRSRR